MDDIKTNTALATFHMNLVL